MSDVVIRAEGLGKRYLIGHQSAAAERYVTLRDMAARSVRELARSARDIVKGRQIVAGDEVEEFWALKEVSFEVRRGDVLGIIGRNGAGKSTLLKILSRITEPSQGRVEIKGRVASLLEVGTGFHPELTGRENIYLNGAILGMSRSEIKRKFDEIVAFAEVERFLDTPVKRYSSGMYVRLAFAVAAHLEPEILIVDEVLAVGDAEFQKKCLGKMQDVAGHGRTILFVSHNLGALASICRQGLVLDNGRVVAREPIENALRIYRTRRRDGPVTDLQKALRGPLTSVEFEGIRMRGAQLLGHASILSDEDLSIELLGNAREPVANFRFAVALFHQGIRVVTIHDGPQNLQAGSFSLSLSIPANRLRPGEYSLAAGGRRTDGDDWIWGTDLALIDIIPKWSAEYDQDDEGILNMSGRLSRRPRPALSRRTGDG